MMTDKEIIAELAAEKASLTNEIADLKLELDRLTQNNEILRRALFGKKTEKTKEVLENSEQLGLFDEAENNRSASEQAEEENLVVTGHTRRKKRTREEIFKDLPVVEEIVEADTVCPKCGADTESIGKEKVRDEIVYEPARMYMKSIYKEVRKCTVCGTDKSPDGSISSVVVKAKVPAPVLPKSFCSPELLAYIIYEKYFKAVPLERLSKQFKEQGCPLSTQTLSNWVIAAAKLYFSPICDKMHRILLKEPLIHADETVVQVLHEEGRKPTAQSRMWVYCSGRKAEHQIRLYEYRPTRAGKNAAAFLNGFSGYLVCDGYAGYNNLPGATRCGCWAHVRRKFRDAIPDDPKLRERSAAKVGFEYCNRIYELERKYKEQNLSDEEYSEKRLDEAKALAGEFFAWAESVNAAPNSNLSKAVGYVLSQKKALMQFINDPLIPLDNNVAERAVKPFVIGRKNWLFSASTKGADASAMIYSVINTANENGVDIQKYLTMLFSKKEPGLPF